MSRQQRLEKKFRAEVTLNHLHIENESTKHQGPGLESHFKIIAVSAQFEGLSLVNRHRLVYTWFADELNNGLHALALHLYTPAEWLRVTNSPQSPPCQSRPINSEKD